MTVNEFLRRFLLPVLPPGFVRIRHFGRIAHRQRGASLPLYLPLLAPTGRAIAQATADEEVVSPPRPLWTGPQCGRPMVLIERLSSAPLRWRSPPILNARQL
jgi:hypothetical protein